MVIATTYISPEEYLKRERVSEVRHEYLNGEVREMVGGTQNHTTILLNLITFLHAALRGTTNFLRASDARIKVKETGLYTYPDLSVVTEEPEWEDSSTETLFNPALIIEILSPSTERYDRGEKFEQHYQRFESFREYLLVAQDRIAVERFERADDGSWKPTIYNSLSDVVRLTSINLDLPVSIIYEGIDLSEDKH